MAGEIPEQQIMDMFSRKDELLAQMIPILVQIRDQAGTPPIDLTEIAGLVGEIDALLKYSHEVDYDVFSLTYPFDGTRLTIAAGTTIYDFMNGNVNAPGASIVSMSNSLQTRKRDAMRALTINANKDVIVQIEGSDKIAVRAGSWPLFPYQRYGKVSITTTESTEILVSASTSAEAIIQMYGEISPSTAGFTGDVYENEHTMTTDAKYSFEATTLLLRDVIIRVSTHEALIGDTSNQRYPRSVGSTLGFTKIDLSKLYIKNAGAGNDTKINVLGTRL
jgi:hypothetical protein